LNPVEVITEKGEKITCEKVLVALPIATLGRIKFGEISQGKQAILSSQLPNVMARQAMIFKTPFWRKLGFSGYVSFSH
jgi:monoamine oxidase